MHVNSRDQAARPFVQADLTLKSVKKIRLHLTDYVTPGLTLAEKAAEKEKMDKKDAILKRAALATALQDLGAVRNPSQHRNRPAAYQLQKNG